MGISGDNNRTDDLDQAYVVVNDSEDNGPASIETKPGGKKGMHVIADINPVPSGGFTSLGTNFSYDDMNVSNGGVPRNELISTRFTDIYSITNNDGGYLFGFLVTLQDIELYWYIRLIVDGVDVFNGSTGILTKDLAATSIYNYNAASDDQTFHIGWQLENDTVRWRAPFEFPIRYESTVKIQVKQESGSKYFRAGLVFITRD
jgi:hypothetical protein